MGARFRVAAVLAALLAAASACGAAELRLGATYTLEDSGILAVLLDAYGRASGVTARAIVAGTGQVMKYAEAGDVDVVFTHSRKHEEALVARGVGKARGDVMWNDFVIAGPASDPARVRGLRDAAEALKRIRRSGSKFASRGDDSGTHKKELELWGAAGGLVRWPGYVATGQGAGRTLMMAHELEAYDLVDRATHRQFARRFPLAVLVEGDRRLVNEYGVTTLRSAATRPVDEGGGELFAAWLTSEAAAKVIAGYRIEGERVFFLPRETTRGVAK